MKRIQIFGLIFSALFLSACSLLSNNCICTMEFDVISVVVVDQNKNPVDSLSFKVIDKLNNTVVAGLVPYDSTSNVYPVLDDSYVHKLSEIPRTFLFEAHKGNISIKQSFLFSTGSCKCHVIKFAGPDTVIVNI